MNPRNAPRANTWFLVKAIARSDFKVRFDDSVLGYLWYLLKPLMLFAVLLAVFSKVMRFQVDHYGLRLLIGIMLWDFFSSGSKIGIDSLSSKANLLTKVYFPRQIIVLSGTITATLTLFFNLVVLLIFLLLYGFWPQPIWLATFLCIIPICLMLMGASFGLGALKVFYGDVLHIWEVVLQLAFWATPIFYPVSIIPASLQPIFLLNPFTGCIEGARSILLDGTIPSMWIFFYSLLVSLIVFLGGYHLFTTREPRFAEVL